MNIDERIEALVQSVELLALNSRDSDKRMDELTAKMVSLSDKVADLVTSSDRLWKLYSSHDRHLSLHEQRLDEHHNRLHHLDGGQHPNG